MSKKEIEVLLPAGVTELKRDGLYAVSWKRKPTYELSKSIQHYLRWLELKYGVSFLLLPYDLELIDAPKAVSYTHLTLPTILLV